MSAAARRRSCTCPYSCTTRCQALTCSWCRAQCRPRSSAICRRTSSRRRPGPDDHHDDEEQDGQHHGEEPHHQQPADGDGKRHCRVLPPLITRPASSLSRCANPGNGGSYRRGGVSLRGCATAAAGPTNPPPPLPPPEPHVPSPHHSAAPHHATPSQGMPHSGTEPVPWRPVPLGSPKRPELRSRDLCPSCPPGPATIGGVARGVGAALPQGAWGTLCSSSVGGVGPGRTACAWRSGTVSARAFHPPGGLGSVRDWSGAAGLKRRRVGGSGRNGRIDVRRVSRTNGARRAKAQVGRRPSYS